MTNTVQLGLGLSHSHGTSLSKLIKNTFSWSNTKYNYWNLHFIFDKIVLSTNKTGKIRLERIGFPVRLLQLSVLTADVKTRSIFMVQIFTDLHNRRSCTESHSQPFLMEQFNSCKCSTYSIYITGPSNEGDLVNICTKSLSYPLSRPYQRWLVNEHCIRENLSWNEASLTPTHMHVWTMKTKHYDLCSNQENVIKTYYV